LTEPIFVWSLLCDHFLIDQAGKQSFIGVFDRIGAMAFPAVQRSLYIAVAMTGDPDSSVPALLDIWSPGGTLLVSTSESRLQFSHVGRAMFVNLLFDLQLPEAGEYSVTVEAGGKPVGTFQFEAYQVPGSPG
jgi:hypothetical protein